MEKLLIDGTAEDYRFNWQSSVKPFPVAAPVLEPEPAPRGPSLVVRAAWTIPVLERISPWVLRNRLAWDELNRVEADKRAGVVERYDHAVEDWKRSKVSFDQQQFARAEDRRRLYESKDRDALLEYWARVLEKPILGGKPTPVRSLDYQETLGKLIVSCALPPVAEIPKIAEVRFSQPLNAIVEDPLSAERVTELHRDLIIKIALVAMYRLFQSDTANALSSIAFNGNIDTIDRATGREVSPCVIAVRADKADVMSMNFALVDTAACLHRLGGKVSGDLADLRPVDPITE
ncbi:MAG: hypothetical protein WCE75_11745 [Terracidiphilus sp.]